MACVTNFLLLFFIRWHLTHNTITLSLLSFTLIQNLALSEIQLLPCISNFYNTPLPYTNNMLVFLCVRVQFWRQQSTALNHTVCIVCMWKRLMGQVGCIIITKKRMGHKHQNLVCLFCQTSGSISSPRVDIRTLEASPAGLPNFTVEQREQGRALLLSWDQPLVPNGVITVHAKHSTEYIPNGVVWDHSINIKCCRYDDKSLFYFITTTKEDVTQK